MPPKDDRPTPDRTSHVEDAADKPTTAEVLALVAELRAAGEWYDYGHGALHSRAADMLIATLPPGKRPPKNRTP